MILSNTSNKNRVLRLNLIIIYILNLSDLFFTKFLLFEAPSLFVEANIFLKPIIAGFEVYILKIVIVAIALFYWGFRCKEDLEKEIKISIIVSRILLCIYIAINLLHLFNLGLLMFLKY